MAPSGRGVRLDCTQQTACDAGQLAAKPKGSLMSRRNVVVVGGILLVAACNSDLGRLAQSVVNEIKGAPAKASAKISEGLKTFWKEVQTVPTTVTAAVQKLPTRGTRALKKLNQRLLAYRLKAFKYSFPADSLSECATAGLAGVGDAFCDTDSDGRSLVVFCADDGVYALAANIFDEKAACAEVDDQVDVATPPATMVDETIMAETEFAADSGSECPADDEGMAACQGTYAIVCTSGKLVELDCSTWNDGKERATCGTLSGAVTCGFDE